ncbi:MAG: nucleotidyltransferase family protein [Betaproteobacteria bacterium]
MPQNSMLARDTPAVRHGESESPDFLTMPAEIAVLRRCARAGPLDTAGLRSALECVEDWTALLDAAEHHGVAALLHIAVEEARSDAVPADAALRLRNAHRESAKRGLFLCAALLAVLDTLQTEGVAALPLKGPVLAAALYPDPALRPSSDVDLLVHRRDIAAALHALARDGYALDSRLARIRVPTLLAVNCEVLVRHPQGAPIDLHWEIAQRGFPFRFDPDVLWRSVRPASLEGRAVPGLAPESQLLFLCVHGAKHLWSHLMWLGDIARLARTISDWDAAMDVAAGAGCARPVLLGLKLAHDLLDAPVPAAIIERAAADPVIPSLARDVVRRLSCIPPVEAGIEDTAFNVRMAKRRWDKAKHYAALLAPSQAELQVLALPPSLRGLYYPFRIARLATKYTMKLAGR